MIFKISCDIIRTVFRTTKTKETNTMWPFKKKTKKYLYRVEYIYSASLSLTSAEFDFRDMVEQFVAADNLLEAQKEFASKNSITPHVYIHSIRRVHSNNLSTE